MELEEQHEDEPHLSRIVVTTRERRWHVGMILDIEYHLRLRASLPTVFIDPEIEPVHATSVPRGVRVDRGRSGGAARVQLTWTAQPTPGEVIVKMRTRWGATSPSRRYGA